MPRQLGSRIVPAPVRKLFGGGKRSSRKGEVDDEPIEVDARLDRRGKRRGQRVRGIARRAQLSQIHLVNRTTGQRRVLHIGQVTGQDRAEIRLPATEKSTVLIEFLQADSQQHRQPLVLTYVSGSSEVTVNGVSVKERAPLGNNAIIGIDAVEYEVELFSFNQLPAVTRVDAAWTTNVGPFRDVNQDAIGLYQHRKAYMFVVSDGVGGGYAGDEVSEFSVQYLLAVFKKNIPYTLEWQDVFQTAFEYINAEVRNFVSTAPGPAGCTLTALFIRDWVATVAHAGDSRLYLLRGAQMRLLTIDHNRNVPVEESPPDGSPPRTRSVLDKAIGKSDTIEPDIFTFALLPRDRLLLVTDGVSNYVSDDEIYQMLATRRIDQVPQALIDLTNARENRDNASAVLLEVLDRAYEQDDWLATPDERVYVGGPDYPLTLEKPREMVTQHPSILQRGCVWLVAAVLILGVVWGGVQVWRLAGRVVESVSQSIEESSAASENSAGGIQLMPVTVAPGQLIPSLTPLSDGSTAAESGSPTGLLGVFQNALSPSSDGAVSTEEPASIPSIATPAQIIPSLTAIPATADGAATTEAATEDAPILITITPVQIIPSLPAVPPTEAESSSAIRPTSTLRASQ
jgi:serine/threonine protein phosphatase PrpC